jgi:hypothetical protein
MKALLPKLLAIQTKIGAVSKTETNPFYNSRYFDINTLIGHIKPYLEEQRLVLVQPLSSIEDRPALKTILFDSESGESLEDTIILSENSDPQKMGSIITYYRRYAIQSLFLLEAEDDDGNAAAKQAPKAVVKPQSQPAAPKPVQSDKEAFTYNGHEYVSAISSKNGQRWWMRRVIGAEKGSFIDQKAFEDAKRASALPEGFEEIEPTLDPLPF